MKFSAAAVILWFFWYFHWPASGQTCLKFPFGHLCRSMDLTGFCMQVSHILNVRKELSISPPYTQFDKIFNKLEKSNASKPFVYFGGYSRPRIYPNCKKPRPPWVPPSPPANDSTGGERTGATDPAPAGNDTRVIMCEPGEIVGAPDPMIVPSPTNSSVNITQKTEQFVANPNYTGCAADCDCCEEPPDDLYAVGTIFTIQDGCELKYIKAPMFLNTDPKTPKVLTSLKPLNDIKKGADALENPYRLSVTEITVNGHRLHNWLHIKIFSVGTVNFLQPMQPCPPPAPPAPPPPPPTPPPPPGPPTPPPPPPPPPPPGVPTPIELGKGLIKMAFIQATDAMGYPVGEFVNTIPCETDCDCNKTNNCHQGTYADTMPCMFDGDRVTTNTGMMLVYASGKDGCGEGLKEIHGTWRFTQSASPESFATELHFWALVVDDLSSTNYQMRVNDSLEDTIANPDLLKVDPPTWNLRISGLSERPTIKLGMFGWNPVFDILHPTVETVGGYDYFREGIHDPKDILCHAPLNSKYYLVEPYPDSGKKIKLVTSKTGRHCYRFDIKAFLKPPKPGVPYKPSKEFNSYCSDAPPSAPTTPMFRYNKRCPGVPGVPSSIPDHFHDTYGFVENSRADKNQTYPWTIPGARIEAYVLRDGGLDEKSHTAFTREPDHYEVYFGTEHMRPRMEYAECALDEKNYYGLTQGHKYPEYARKYELVPSSYGHSCRFDMTGRRVLNLPLPIKNWPNVLAKLWKLPVVDSTSFENDRCFCAEKASPVDVSKIRPPEIVVQGRRQHAYQMIIAWNMIIPFSIFVSRYYKETYSKVFFLQEYWWYTIHVLCMVSAAMFTFGGLYVIELKRRVNERGIEAWWKSVTYYWSEETTMAHMVIGIVIIGVFFYQCVTGFFRLKDPRKRKLQILTHWLFGVLEYVLAVVCMIISAAMTFSGMSCSGVGALGLLVIVQVMFYASMEVHMRNVDNQLQLKPKRSYLPPPVMRVFHKDAPEAKFRIWILLAYLALCVITSLLQMLSLLLNDTNNSCFKNFENIDRGDGSF